MVSKFQITPKIKARADEKAQHTLEYVSILRRLATLKFGVRWDLEIISNIVHCFHRETQLQQKTGHNSFY